MTGTYTSLRVDPRLKGFASRASTAILRQKGGVQAHPREEERLARSQARYEALLESRVRARIARALARATRRPMYRRPAGPWIKDPTPVPKWIPKGSVIELDSRGSYLGFTAPPVPPTPVKPFTPVPEWLPFGSLIEVDARGSFVGYTAPPECGLILDVSVPTWAEARKAKIGLEKRAARNVLRPWEAKWLRSLRRVTREKASNHADLLLNHCAFSKEWRHLHTREDIPRGVKAPTSRRQTKQRSVIPESSSLWTDEELATRVPEVAKPKAPRQARLGLLLDSLVRPQAVAQMPSEDGFVLLKEKPKTVFGLVEGLLRAKALQFERQRPGFLEDLKREYELQTAEPQMEQVHEDSPVSFSQEGNVVLQNPEAESRAQRNVPVGRGFLAHSSATESQTFEQITNRWLKYSHQITWKTTDETGKELLLLNLPRAIIEDNPTSPNVLPLLVHRYGRFGMKVKIVVNSNKFQVGQLQVSWRYNAGVDAHKSMYDDLYSASQRRHVIINAGASNWGELDIPYWALTSATPLKLNANELDQEQMALILGQLSIKVLSPLAVGTGEGFLMAHCMLYVSFYDMQLRGLCDRDLHVIRPQMEDLVNTTEAVLHLVKPALSLDKPLKPAVAMSVQPMAARSFGTVGGQNEVLRSLRSDPLAQTPGIVSGEGNDATLSSLLNRWSLVNRFNWKNTDEMGTKLWTMDSAPLGKKSMYDSRVIGSKKFYNLPIIAYLSSLFAYWRGDIEVRIDFVATQFHSGSICIATIPSGVGTETLDQAKNSGNVVFSLMDSHQVTYRIPYYGNVPFWQTKHGLERIRDIAPPSCTSIYVVNPLLPMPSVAQSIECLIYVRAADNFEFALLRSPSIGLAFNPTVLEPDTSKAWVDPVWPQMFTSGSRWFPVGSRQAMSFFDSETTDYFTQFLNLQFGVVYRVPDSTMDIKVQGFDKFRFRCQYYKDADNLADVPYMVRAKQYPDYPVVVLFSTEKAALEYAKDPSRIGGAILEVRQGPWAQYSTDEGKTWYNVTRGILPLVPFSQVVSDWELVASPQMEQTGSVRQTIALDTPARTTGAGHAVFGESVSSLIDIGKRWQYCGSGTLTGQRGFINQCVSEGGPLLKINTHPIRTFDVTSSASRANRLRDGAISIICAGFTGYRGSMRYRLVLSESGSNNLSFSVVHKFDRRVNMASPTVHVDAHKAREAKDWFDTAYAAELQSTYVNNVLEFEVPFYNRGEYNSLYVLNEAGTDAANNYQAAGEVLVYVAGLDLGSILNIEVFYSLGDDMVLSNFQGFPYVFFLDEIPAEPQMEYIKAYFTTPLKVGTACDVLKAAAGSVADTVTSAVSSLATTVKKIITAPFVSKGMDSISSVLSSCSGFAHLIFTQIMHIIANPLSKVTIAISLFSVLLVLFSDKLSGLLELVKGAVKACWNWLFGKNKPNHSEPEVATPQSEDSDSQATFVSLLWSLAATAVGFIGRAPSNMLEFTKGLFKSSSDAFRTHVFGVKFFKDFLEMMKRCWSWINRKLGFEKPLYVLTSNDAFLKEWAVSASVLLAPENDNLIRTNKEWTSKLFEVQIMGRLIKQATLNTEAHITRELSSSILRMQSDLTKKVESLVKQKCYVPIRQEPFICWFVGEPGLGKSFTSQKVMREMAYDYKIDPSIFSLCAGQRYFDLLREQRFVLLDDFLNWIGESATEIYGQYLQMSGSNMLSLPRSAVDDKAIFDNFEFIFVTANQMWFNQSCGVKEPEAYNRRRHVTVVMKNTAEYLKNYTTPKAAATAYRKGSDEYKESGADIEYEIYENDDTKPSFVVTGYKELYQKLKTYSDKQRTTAERQYFRAVEEHTRAVRAAAADVSSFSDFFEKMKKISVDVPTGELSKCVQSDVQDSLTWLSDRLKARFQCFETVQPSKDGSELEKALKQTAVDKVAKPNMEEPGPSRMVGTVEDAMAAALRAVADYEEKQSALLNRFVDTWQGLFRKPNFPKLECEDDCNFLERPGVADLCRVFPDNLPTTYCPHRFLRFSNCVYYRFSDELKTRLVTRYGTKSQPSGMFIDIEGVGRDYKPDTQGGNVYRTYAAFDTPCAFHESLNHGCSWIVGDKTIPVGKMYEWSIARCPSVSNRKLADVSEYWSSLIVTLAHYGRTWPEFASSASDSILTLVPAFFKKHLDEIYKRDSAVFAVSEPGMLSQLLNTISGGFLADRVTVDGIDHATYPEGEEVYAGVRNGETVEIKRSKGLLWHTVEERGPAGSSVRRELSTFTKMLALLGMLIAGISMLCVFLDIIFYFLEYWGFFSLWCWNKGGSEEPQMSTSGDFKVSKQSNKATTKAVQMLKVADNGIGTEEADGVLNKIIKNTFFIIADNPELGKRKTARCLGVYEHSAIVLSHYMENFAYLQQKEAGWEFSLYRYDTKTIEPCDFSKFTFEYPSAGGYCLMKFPPGSTLFRDITKFMPKEGVANYPGTALLIEPKVDCVKQTELDIKLSFKRQLVSASPDTGMADWTIDQKFEYSKGGFGLCGSFLYCPGNPTPLIGIHTAGIGQSVGFSELLLRETFCTVENKVHIEMVTPNLSVNEDLYVPEGPHVSVGHVDRDMAVIIPNKTRIIPSMVAGVFETRTEPAPLSELDPRLPPNSSPLNLAVEKRCDLIKPFNTMDLDKAVADVENMILTNCKPVRACVSVLSVQQAIEGIPGIHGMEPLELKTSEGYPWVKMRPKTANDKRWLFEMDYSGPHPVCNGVAKELKSVLDLKEKMRARGVAPATYFTACLKDSRILKEKCSIPGKTRLFEMSPVDLSIAQRQHYLDFYASYMHNRRKCENTIGINVNGEEWSLLAMDLTSFSEYILGGDYSSYGPRMSIEVLHRVWDIKSKWMLRNMCDQYDPSELSRLCLIMNTMKYECLNSLLVVGRYVMRALGGMHSGNVATVILNSMCNSVLVRLAYLGVMRKAKSPHASLTCFNKYVRMFSNGDDLIVAVAPEIIEVFNNVSISAFFASHGMKYTNSKKDQLVVPYETIFEVQYLKCAFQPHPLRSGAWLAPLAVESVEDCAQWIWDRDLAPWDATIANCEQAVRLAYGHGPDYFNLVRGVLLDRLQREGKYVVFPTWDELDESVWDFNLPIVQF
uniref:Genome polyprotein n=1 Tax=Moksystermes virus TaxID=2796616 RepID=A0A7T7K9J1_9VIRU|nr:polyprotein [Moksystermes virus]